MTMVEKVAQAIADNINAGLPDGVETDVRYAALAAIEAMTSFIEGIPLNSLTKTSETDPKMIWAISAESQRRSIVRHLQAALKEGQ